MYTYMMTPVLKTNRCLLRSCLKDDEISFGTLFRIKLYMIYIYPSSTYIWHLYIYLSIYIYIIYIYLSIGGVGKRAWNSNFSGGLGNLDNFKNTFFSSNNSSQMSNVIYSPYRIAWSDNSFMSRQTCFVAIICLIV